MKWKVLVLAVGFCLAIGSSAQAVDWNKILCLDWCWPQCAQPTCCDDYCGKPLPCVPAVRCCECDNYCAESAPCVKRICKFVCDDYCCKCPPVIRCPDTTHLKCVPTSNTCCVCGQSGCQKHKCKHR